MDLLGLADATGMTIAIISGVMIIAITDAAVPKDMAATTVANSVTTRAGHAPSRKGSGLSKPAAWTRRGGVWKKRDAVLRKGVAAVTDVAKARMEDARQFGLVLADTTVAEMDTEGLSGQEAAVFAAAQVVRRADAMVAAGETRDAAAAWSEVVIKAYGARLDERIKATKELVDLRLEKPQ